MSILDTLKKKVGGGGKKKESTPKEAKATEKKAVVKNDAPKKAPEAEKKVSSSKDSKKAATYAPKSRAEDVLLRPHITEKASELEQRGVYVFAIDKRAGKNDVKSAIISIYGKTPSKINIIKLPSKNVVSRGKRGVKSGVKKAYVYFPKGVTIEVM